MSKVMNLAEGVDTVLLIRHLVFIKLAQVVGGGDTGEVQFVTANGDAYAIRFSLVGVDT